MEEENKISTEEQEEIMVEIEPTELEEYEEV